jgi:uncharacterized membrane protein YphA (DoxX/SURF4 family)
MFHKGQEVGEKNVTRPATSITDRFGMAPRVEQEESFLLNSASPPFLSSGPSLSPFVERPNTHRSWRGRSLLSFTKKDRMIAAYLLTFCRIAIGLVFLSAFLGKVRASATFRQTITDFRMLPPSLSQKAALLFLSGELGIVVCMVLGGVLLFPGFLLAVLQLCVFSGALLVVVRRKQRMTCNCFGAGTRQISSLDLYRNAGLILCAALGSVMQRWLDHQVLSLGIVEWILVGLVAGAFALLWTQSGELIHLLRQSH